jgi:hypothetical protein
LRAWLNLRYALSERWQAFQVGLERLGYRVEQGVTNTPGPRDILVTWNRIGVGDIAARHFEAAGLPVIVAENAAWGNEGGWLSLARNWHNTADRVTYGGWWRWEACGFELEPWRIGSEVVILPQRGIGSPPVAMPRDWPARAQASVGGRIRAHPGQNACVPLREDLADCRLAVTWGSGAAIKALMWGVPVQGFMPNWIGHQDNTDDGRRRMFEKLAWAQWRLPEIASGEAFRWVLQ